MRKAQLQGCEQYLIPICCVCRQVRDDDSDDGAWLDLETYMHQYGILEANSLFTHTFCPPCLIAYKKQFGLDGEMDVSRPHGQLVA